MKLLELNYGTNEYFQYDTGDKYLFQDIDNLKYFVINEIIKDYQKSDLLEYMTDQVEDFFDKGIFQMDFYDQENRATELYIDINEVFTVD